ncbi:MAG: hypothetical protein QM736_12735 [Vicinamibacterales bacterium]
MTTPSATTVISVVVDVVPRTTVYDVAPATAVTRATRWCRLPWNQTGRRSERRWPTRHTRYGPVPPAFTTATR